MGGILSPRKKPQLVNTLLRSVQTLNSGCSLEHAPGQSTIHLLLPPSIIIPLPIPTSFKTPPQKPSLHLFLKEKPPALFEANQPHHAKELDPASMVRKNALSFNMWPSSSPHLETTGLDKKVCLSLGDSPSGLS